VPQPRWVRELAEQLTPILSGLDLEHPVEFAVIKRVLDLLPLPLVPTATRESVPCPDQGAGGDRDRPPEDNHVDKSFEIFQAELDDIMRHYDMLERVDVEEAHVEVGSSGGGGDSITFPHTDSPSLEVTATSPQTEETNIDTSTSTSTKPSPALSKSPSRKLCAMTLWFLLMNISEQSGPLAALALYRILDDVSQSTSPRYATRTPRVTALIAQKLLSAGEIAHGKDVLLRAFTSTHLSGCEGDEWAGSWSVLVYFGCPELVRSVLSTMREAGIPPGTQAYTCLIRTLASAGQSVGALQTLQEMKALGVPPVSASYAGNNINFNAQF